MKLIDFNYNVVIFLCFVFVVIVVVVRSASICFVFVRQAMQVHTKYTNTLLKLNRYTDGFLRTSLHLAIR